MNIGEFFWNTYGSNSLCKYKIHCHVNDLAEQKEVIDYLQSKEQHIEVYISEDGKYASCEYEGDGEYYISNSEGEFHLVNCVFRKYIFKYNKKFPYKRRVYFDDNLNPSLNGGVCFLNVY